MRTTILLPDDLYDDVKITAARERRTVTSVIEEALREALDRRAAPVERPPYVVRTLGNGRPRVAVDLSDNGALLDLMDHEEPAGRVG